MKGIQPGSAGSSPVEAYYPDQRCLLKTEELTEVPTGLIKSALILAAALATRSPMVEPEKESTSIPASQLEGPFPWTVRFPVVVAVGFL